MSEQALFVVPWAHGRPDLALSEDDAGDGLTGYSVATGEHITPETTRARVRVYATAGRIAAMEASAKFERVS